MIPAKLKGLNQDTSDESNDEDEENPVTKEALEQRTQSVYREALILQKQNKLENAEVLLKQLVESDTLIKALGKVKYVNGRVQPSVFHLKYCCYLNLGNILFKMKNYSLALENYLIATELDDTDLNLWYRIGNVAMKIPNLTVAVSAFMETLRRNPRHWPSVDLIVTATFVLGDMMSCLLYISQGLKLDPSYFKGIVFKEHIFREHPSLKRDFKMFFSDFDLSCNDTVFDENEASALFSEINRLKSKDLSLNKKLFGVKRTEISIKGLSKPLTNCTWLCLGESLLKLYKLLYEDDSEMSFCSIINLNLIEDKKELLSEGNIVSVTTKNENTAADFNKSIEKKNNDDNVQHNENNKNDEDGDDILKELRQISSKETEKDIADGGNKSKKRKCSPTLADQLKICDKRRSARNKSMLKSNEPSLSKTLKNMIPINLLPEKDKNSTNDCYDFIRWNEDSFDTMDIYRLLFENQDQNNLPSYPVNDLSEETRKKLLSEESYFDTDKEKLDIEWFVKIYNEQTIFQLLEAYVKEISLKWCYTWPSKLTNIYLEMYQILIKHGFEDNRIKVPESWYRNVDFDEDQLKSLSENVKTVLLYGELLLNQYFGDNSKEKLLEENIFGGNFCSLLIGDLHDACFALNAYETDIKLWMRTYWLEAIMFLQKRDTFSSCCALSMLVEDILDVNLEVRLPNMKQFHVISQRGAKRLLNTLNRNQNLSEVKPLFRENQFSRVIEILENTLKPDSQQLMHLPNENTLSRYEQYSLLLAALWESKNYEELCKWCEIGFYESFAIYRKSFFDETDADMKCKWASLTMNTLSGMLSCFQTVGLSVLNSFQNENLSRLVQTLRNLVCHQIEATDPSPEILSDTVTPWILLCNILIHNEKKDNINVTSDERLDVVIPSSISLLFVAHEHLGRRNWCCFDDGALLFYTLDVIESLFHKCFVYSEPWVLLAQQIDQIFYCLYSHPFKRNKPRHVQDHNSLGLALTWNRAVQAYLFYRPCKLPMFDAASKSCTITADTETLFKRMVSLIPEEQHPSRSLESINQYINGNLDKIPESENKLQEEIIDLFYLLADYYFKNKIMGKAIKYYSLDVCSNPYRVDSWSAMALARGSQLEMKLNSCETIKSETDILKKTELTDRCYKTALNLDSSQSTLWIEYGVFCYGIHGFCSRLLKQETTNLSLQMFELLENCKNDLLKTSFSCFNSATEKWIALNNDQMEVQDERWLHHYMLGKIAEKKEEKPDIYLNHYLEASKLLHQNGAVYPMRILYSQPQYYSVESFEIYYRIHATILKLLEAHEEKCLDHDSLQTLNRVIDKIAESPFAKARANWPKKSNVIESATLIKTAVKDAANKENNTKNIEKEVKEILDEILLKVCICRTSVSKRKNTDENHTWNEQDDTTQVKKSRMSSDDGTPPQSIETEKSAEDVEVISIDIDYSDNNDEVESNNETAAVNAINNVQKCTESKENTSNLEKQDDLDTLSSDSSTGDSSSDSSSDDSSSSSSESEEETLKDNNNMNVMDVQDNSLEKQQNLQKIQRNLVDKCLAALEECIQRFPEHYKSYYRLAHHYFRSKWDKNIEKARHILLEEGGLYSERKSSNFFCGIWRIPTGEIDRSGSFAFHMSRSIHLLMDILRDTQDYKMLLNLSVQLRDMPDQDKKYLRDNEREQLCKEALSLAAQALRKHIDEVSSNEKEENIRKLLLEVYKCYYRFCKFFSQKDAPFGKLLSNIFYKYTNKQDKISLEQILSFCKTLNSLNKNSSVSIPSIPMSNNSTSVNKNSVQAINFSLNDVKSQLAGYVAQSDLKVQSMMQKLANDIKNNFTASSSIPNNLKNLPSSISVTTVPTFKSKSAIPASQLFQWNTNASNAMIKMLHKEKEKYKSKFDQQPKRIMNSNKPRPILRPIAKEKIRHHKSKYGNSFPVKNDQKIDKNILPTSLDKGLLILPILPKDTKISPIQPNIKSSPPSSLSAPNSKSVKSVSDMIVVSKGRPSLIITPVDPSKNQPTLQQKLAAKQLANKTRLISSLKIK